MIKKLLFTTGLVFASVFVLSSQSLFSTVDIVPDARSAGMGDAGIALRADGNSVFHNTAGIGFSDYRTSVSVNYVPWMHYGGEIGNKSNQFSLGGYYQLNSRHSVALGLRYFDDADITYNDGVVVKPMDLILDLGYSYLLNENMGISANARYLNGKVYPGSALNGFGFDLGFQYRKEGLSAAFTLKNVGPSIESNSESQNMPASANAGVAYEYDFTGKHTLTGSLQLGYNFMPSEASYFGGGLGVEYMYDRMLAVRAGYRYGDGEQGGASYATAGLGFYYGPILVDASYLIATSETLLRNTWRVSLGVRF